MRGKVKFDQFIKSDIDRIASAANFTPEQRRIFDELCLGELNDIGIAAKLNLSESSFYARKKIILDKIARIMQSY